MQHQQRRVSFGRRPARQNKGGVLNNDFKAAMGIGPLWQGEVQLIKACRQYQFLRHFCLMMGKRKSPERLPIFALGITLV
jgi:hypothetical protein